MAVFAISIEINLNEFKVFISCKLQDFDYYQLWVNSNFVLMKHRHKCAHFTGIAATGLLFGIGPK